MKSQSLDENRKIEQHLLKNDEEIKTVFAYLKKFIVQENKPGNPIAFKIPR